MPGREPQVAQDRAITYCIVPRELATQLHEPLRKHFADTVVEVVVERRTKERRGHGRRSATADAPEDRRRIRNVEGRRVGERRAPAVPVEAPPLPRRFRDYAEQVVFVERIVPSDQREEDLDTARLVMRFQAGERDVFAELYMRYFDRVYGYMRVILGQPADAEEAVQQVFTNVLEALPGYEHRKEPFRGWLFVVARNQAVTQLRKSSRLELYDPADLEREGLEEGQTSLGDLGWITDHELLLFIERLPVAQRQVLALRYMLDMTHAQIAQVLDRSPEDVRMQLSRAQAFLRKRLLAVRRGSGDRRRTPVVRRPSHAYLLRARRFALMR
jgi:RNA polymerase sigma-70 factor (ECF subfamily)